MIGTLFVQEWRTTRKYLLITIGIALLVAAVSLIPGILGVPVLREFGFLLGMIAVVLITPMTFGLLIENYWRTMYGREGYFTMSLPVRGRAIFTAKVLYGILVAMLAFAITVAGAAGILSVIVSAQGEGVREQVSALFDALDPLMYALLVGVPIAEIVLTVIAGAAVMSIGSEARFNRLGFGAPVIGGVILYFVLQITNLVAMLFIPFGIRIHASGGSELDAQSMLSEIGITVEQISGSASEPESMVLGLGGVVVSVIFAIVLAWWGSRSVDRRTSLR